MLFYAVIIAVLGLLIGSFINVLICRIPEGKSIIAPPSSCMKCGTQLKPLDLIPVFSYLFLGGKCRYCKTSISPRYPLVELATACTFLGLYIVYGLSVQFAAFAFLTILLTAIFFIDIDHRIIPDELVIAGLIGGLPVFVYNLFNPLPAYGDSKWWTPLVGIVTGSGILLLIAFVAMIIYKSDDAMGMGDVKLFAPIGFFLGWKLCLAALFVSILLAGTISLLLMIIGKKGRKDTIPYGPFIVSGTYIIMLFGWDLVNWYISRL
jgi:leader peptidase (prepilin peptidase)/N-methyltransferase